VFTIAKLLKRTFCGKLLLIILLGLCSNKMGSHIPLASHVCFPLAELTIAVDLFNNLLETEIGKQGGGALQQQQLQEASLSLVDLERVFIRASGLSCS
jgi:hypothetical protein